MRRIDKKNLQGYATRTIISAIDERSGICGNAGKIKCDFYRSQIAANPAGTIFGTPYIRGRFKWCYAVIPAIGADRLVNNSIPVIAAGTSVHVFADTAGPVILSEKSCIEQGRSIFLNNDEIKIPVVGDLFNGIRGNRHA